MTKQLPYIAIEGVGNTPQEVLDSLIAIEPLLVMMGWDVPDEDWNNHRCDENVYNNSIYGYVCGVLNYHNHIQIIADLRFKSTEIDKLIKYMITNKFIK